MAQYAILLFEGASAGSDADHQRHADELLAEGVVVAAFALASGDTATTVSGDALTDGPFAEAKEVVAGICIVEAPDLDAAIEIARRNPSAQFGGKVEVRPVAGGIVASR